MNHRLCFASRKYLSYVSYIGVNFADKVTQSKLSPEGCRNRDEIRIQIRQIKSKFDIDFDLVQGEKNKRKSELPRPTPRLGAPIFLEIAPPRGVRGSSGKEQPCYVIPSNKFFTSKTDIFESPGVGFGGPGSILECLGGSWGVFWRYWKTWGR